MPNYPSIPPELKNFDQEKDKTALITKGDFSGQVQKVVLEKAVIYIPQKSVFDIETFEPEG